MLKNGQAAKQETFNNAFVSKTDESTVTGTINLNNGETTQVTDIQAVINAILSRLTATESETSTNSDDIDAIESVLDINALDEKLVPIAGDFVLIEDSEDSNNKKKVNLANLYQASH